MNKEIFAAKCQELYAYEDELLKKVSEYVKPYNEEMNKYGYKVVARLLWLVHDEKDYEQFECVKTRQVIVYKKSYFCYINVIICSIETDLSKELEEDADKTLGIMINDIASGYSLFIWKGWAFSRGDAARIYKDLGNICDDVKNMGLENAGKKYEN